METEVQRENRIMRRKFVIVLMYMGGIAISLMGVNYSTLPDRFLWGTLIMVFGLLILLFGGWLRLQQHKRGEF